MISFEITDEGLQDVLPVECHVTRLEINDGKNVWELRSYSDAGLEDLWATLGNNIRIYRLMEQVHNSALPHEVKGAAEDFLDTKLCKVTM